MASSWRVAMLLVFRCTVTSAQLGTANQVLYYCADGTRYDDLLPSVHAGDSGIYFFMNSVIRKRAREINNTCRDLYTKASACTYDVFADKIFAFSPFSAHYPKFYSPTFSYCACAPTDSLSLPLRLCCVTGVCVTEHAIGGAYSIWAILREVSLGLHMLYCCNQRPKRYVLLQMPSRSSHQYLLVSECNTH